LTALQTDLLTVDERAALDTTVALVNQFSSLLGDEASAPGDYREFVHHVHAIQNMILAQAAARAYPDRYRLMGETLRHLVPTQEKSA
jgi:hypothetical protein